jgi:hypothetical protein
VCSVVWHKELLVVVLNSVLNSSSTVHRLGYSQQAVHRCLDLDSGPDVMFLVCRPPTDLSRLAYILPSMSSVSHVDQSSLQSQQVMGPARVL